MASVCRICGNQSNNKEVVLQGTMYGTHGRYPYFQCSKCGCLQIKEEVENLEKYYDTGQYYSFNMDKRKLKNELLFAQMKQQTGRFSLIGRLVGLLYPVNYRFYRLVNKDAAILDVGCGDGEMLRWLKRLGYSDVMGIDPFIGQDIRMDGELLVAKGDLRDYPFQKAFDMITMIHSLEHVYEQQEQMRALDNCLKPRGYLVFQLPVFSRYYWDKYQSRLYTLDPPRHCYLHTKESLRILLEPFGYQMISYETEIDVAIPQMARNVEAGQTEKNGGTGFVSGTVQALKSGKLRKRLKEGDDGAIATAVFQKK